MRRLALDDVVVLNVDTNTLETPYDDLQSLPSDVVRSYCVASRFFHMTSLSVQTVPTLKPVPGSQSPASRGLSLKGRLVKLSGVLRWFQETQSLHRFQSLSQVVFLVGRARDPSA